MTQTPILTLLDSNQLFIVGCATSHMGIKVVLSQEGKSVAFFSEKIANSKRCYSTYDLDHYALVCDLQYWQRYLLYQIFVVYMDHEGLWHLNS